MGKRIEFDEAARGALRRGVEQLAGAMRVTLGPRGRNVVIDRLGGLPTITSDGAAIAREIELADPLENLGARFVREVAAKTAEIAGDGTTTATVLARSLVCAGLEAVSAGRNPVALKRGMDRAVAAVVEALRRGARVVSSREDMAQVAAVSAGDARIGALVAEAVDRVGRHGVVTVVEGSGMDLVLELVEGARFEGGWLSPYFVNRPDEMEAVLENPLVLLCEARLEGARDVLGPLEHAAAAARPLLVVAVELETEALATLVVNRLRGRVEAVAVKAPGFGERRLELLEDLAALTGARLVGRGEGAGAPGPADFGRARRVVVDRDSTTLVAGGGRPEELRERVAGLRRRLEQAPEHDREWLRERLGRLTGGVAVVRVGAPTEMEIRERRVRVDDALAATLAAVEEGVVVGGGVALLRARGALEGLALEGDEAAGAAIVGEALEQPARQIAANAGEDGAAAARRILEGEGGFGFNALTGRYEDLAAAGILDPVKVVRVGLEHAASISGVVLTTDVIVVDEEEEEEEPPAPEAGEGGS